MTVTSKPTPPANVAECRQRCRDWAANDALPLWFSRGLHPGGGFFEALDFSGQPLASPRSRVRVQARQVFSLCVARELELMDDGALGLIERGLDFVQEACRRDDGLYGCVVDLDKRELIDPTPDLYDTAFVLLALSRAYGLLGSARLATAIDALLDGLDRAFARSPGDGFHERLPPPPERRQNPHMHLFESCLTLAAATGDAAHRQRADGLLAFVRERFIDTDAGIVWERVDDKGETLARSFEPGHSFEWVWLLAEHRRVLGTAGDLGDVQSRLYETAVRVVGDAPRIGLEATLKTMPPEHGARLWSMTEALRAHLEMGRHGNAAATGRAVATCNAIFRDWLAPAVAGGWYDHFDGAGRMVSADMPASSLYHIMTAIEALDIAGR